MNATKRELLVSLAKGIALVFGECCEVIVHETTDGRKNSVLAVENGYISGRRVGDTLPELDWPLPEYDPERRDRGNRLAQTREGRVVKTGQILVRDDRGRIESVIAINYDVTELIRAHSALNAVIGASSREEPNIRDNSIHVNELLERLLAQADRSIWKPVAMMTKEDKVRCVHFLEKKGAFLIKKAGDKVSHHYGISKYTLYNYLGTTD